MDVCLPPPPKKSEAKNEAKKEEKKDYFLDIRFLSGKRPDQMNEIFQGRYEGLSSSSSPFSSPPPSSSSAPRNMQSLRRRFRLKSLTEDRYVGIVLSSSLPDPDIFVNWLGPSHEKNNPRRCHTQLLVFSLVYLLSHVSGLESGAECFASLGVSSNLFVLLMDTASQSAPSLLPSFERLLTNIANHGSGEEREKMGEALLKQGRLSMDLSGPMEALVYKAAVASKSFFLLLFQVVQNTTKSFREGGERTKEGKVRDDRLRLLSAHLEILHRVVAEKPKWLPELSFEEAVV